MSVLKNWNPKKPNQSPSKCLQIVLQHKNCPVIHFLWNENYIASYSNFPSYSNANLFCEIKDWFATPNLKYTYSCARYFLKTWSFQSINDPRHVDSFEVWCVSNCFSLLVLDIIDRKVLTVFPHIVSTWICKSKGHST